MTISLAFGFFAVAVLAACIILLLLYAWKMKQHYLSLQESYKNLEKLNSNLRAQRHDYLNHLQVVYGLMEMEDSDTYRFSVSNNGPMIPKEMQESIFKQGITTKKGEGHGMGLYIVSNVLGAYKGTMKLVSEENETTFSFSLPKEERRKKVTMSGYIRSIGNITVSSRFYTGRS